MAKFNFTKDDFLKYLSDTATRETSYHNIKETIAWAAILLYFVLMIEVVKSLRSWPYVATFFILGAFIVVVYILHYQFRLRKEAAKLIGACHRLIVEYLPKGEECLQNVDFTVTSLQKETKQFPKFFDYGLTGQYPYILPNVLLDMMKKMDQVGHEPRIGLEKGSYLLVTFGFIITLMIIWSAILEVISVDIQEWLASYLF
ncbi:MAG TPA: hypothetical protein VLZ10_04205 [Thermodesulfobacteriota bacterium]|nr:hypothetical protein [Thermodesulfobacteriota bacterium]